MTTTEAIAEANKLLRIAHHAHAEGRELLTEREKLALNRLVTVAIGTLSQPPKGQKGGPQGQT